MNYQEQRATAFRGLLERLARESALPTIAAAEVASRAAGTPLLAVLFTGEASRSPESWDVCVVLPELLASCLGVAGCVLDPEQSALAQAAYGVGKLPALVVLRAGQYLGVIEGMQDWEPFVTALRRLSAAAPGPIPAAGVYRAAAVTAGLA